MKQGSSEATIKDFSARISIKYQPIYELSQEIYKKTKADPDWMDVDFLFSQPYKVRLLRISDDTMVYEITDSAYGMESENYVYRFAMKYRL